MSAPAMQFALQAKQREIEALQLLADRIKLTDLLGRLMHAVQRERGITSIYLASGGKRFLEECGAVRQEVDPIVIQLREDLELQLAPERGATARMLSLIAWVLLDLDSLDTLRARIDDHAVSAPDSVMVFSKIIGGLMELVFQLADGASDPAISRILVALVHVVQSKEAAGQERAVGAHMFAAGTFSPDQQHRLTHLINAQELSLDVFMQFANADLCKWWQTQMLTPHVATLERLRRIVCTARAGDSLDSSLSEAWFNASSARITDLWNLQTALAVHVSRACDAKIEEAQQALSGSEDLMQRLRDNPPPHSQALEHFFARDPDSGASAHLSSDRLSSSDHSTSLKSVLYEQSARLSRMEVELDVARRALHERKLLDRAKTSLMARYGLSEDAAFRMLQKASMDQSRRLADVAEAALASPDSLLAAQSHSNGSASSRQDEPVERSSPTAAHDALKQHVNKPKR